MQKFSDTVRAIYDSALTPEAWPAALEKIAEIFDAPGAVIYFADSKGQTDFIASNGVLDAVRIYQEENWGPRDMHAHRILEMHLEGRGDVAHDQLMVTAQEIETLPIYTDFFARVGFGWIMGCVILPDLDMLVLVSVPRARERGPYDAADLEKLRLIGAHVEQALRISLRIANMDSVDRVLRAALDTTDSGVFGLDDDGHLVFANAAGEAMFPELFATIDGRVAPLVAAEARRFAALVAAAHAGEGAEGPPQCCVLTRRDGARTAVWAMPVAGSEPWRIGGGRPARTLLLASPVERDRRIDPSVIRDAFRLSLGEARHAALVGGGATVSDAAERLGVTEGTARVVLKRVFRKLGVNRQAELVLRLSALGGAAPRMPAATGPGGPGAGLAS